MLNGSRLLKNSGAKNLVVTWALLAGLSTTLTGAPSHAKPAAPAVGDQAPDFRLVGTDGKTYTLDQFRGKSAVVLAWYPKALTPGCTAECLSLRDTFSKFSDFKVQVFGISVDSLEDNQKFAERYQLNFVLLSDPEKTYAHALHVLRSDPELANRWTYIIDDQGIIREIDRAVRPSSHGPDLIEKLKSLSVFKKDP